MLFGRAPLAILLLCTASCWLTSCLARLRLITRADGKPEQKLLVADRATLIARIATQFEAVRAHILFRKPGHIRLIGLDFRLHVPAKNRFLVGRNTSRTPCWSNPWGRMKTRCWKTIPTRSGPFTSSTSSGATAGTSS